MKILAIETSCDETAAAVIEGDMSPKISSNVISSQIDIHKDFGGVVPEVAARAHIENIIPVITRALKESHATLDDIDYLAVTRGPGLIGSLVVGVETVKAISAARNIPIVPVNHLEGHLYANFLDTKPQFPLLALIVSGGHTMLVLVREHLSYKVIGTTRDDAAGEAFDKAAKLLGLPYPGGPAISKAAEKGDKDRYSFPIIDLTEKPYRDKDGFLRYPEPSLDFSFSGLKTALLKIVKEKKSFTKGEVNNLAASFEKAIVDNLLKNVLLAIERHKPKTFILSGGVAANRKLRENLKQELENKYPKVQYLIPEITLCTDNAAMIGAAAFYHIKKGSIEKESLIPVPNLKIS
ncbi:MAG: tRNA (adenosine(37)-N6)-threonylcarbamoyltransferase complex transferase subunit TsaD [Patescibacteria group bacterium]|nr:tRNA (adenosine(37)-N6)-threonylcarbamoyltransferase complex transferase subunit TsaD [Patescibacteria group bacterium]